MTNQQLTPESASGHPIAIPIPIPIRIPNAIPMEAITHVRIAVAWDYVTAKEIQHGLDALEHFRAITLTR